MLTPFYEADNITLYLGDCREILPQLKEKFDLVLTDPPYGLKWTGTGFKKQPLLDSTEVGEWDRRPEDEDDREKYFCRWRTRLDFIQIGNPANL